RIASGERAARQLAHPAMQGERDKHGDTEDHERDQRIGQPVEQILDLGQRGSEFIHGLSYHPHTGAEYRISPSFRDFPLAGQYGGEVAKGPAFQSFSSAAANE